MSSPEKARINRISGFVGELRGDEWLCEADSDGFRVIARRATGERVHIATIQPSAASSEIELICAALDHARLFLRSRDEAVAAFLDLRRQLGNADPAPELEKRGADYTTQVSILLSDKAFQAFLEWRCKVVVADEGAADAALKHELRIDSKTKLNKDGKARAEWIQLWSDFEHWKRNGEGVS